MANTLTLNASRSNTTLPVEFLNPATNTWVDGVQQPDGSYRAVLTGIPAGTYSGLKCRLKGSSPEIAGTFAQTVTVLGAGTTPAPTIASFAPSSGAVGSQVVLTGTGFTGATLVSINSGAVASYVVNSATQITAVLSGSQATGKVRVTTPGGTAVSAVDFTVQGSTAPTTPTTLTPVTADYGSNGGLNRASSLSGSRAALSTLTYSTTDPQPSIVVQSGMHDFGTNYAAVFNGLNLVGTYAPTSDGSPQTFQLPPLTGATPYQLTIVNGIQQRSYEQGDVRGTELVSITSRANYSISKVVPTKAAKLAICFNDSILPGAGSTVPQTKSAAAILRAKGYDVVCYGYGSAQATVTMATGNRADVQAFVQAASAGYSDVTFLLTEGTNDYHGAMGGTGVTTPATLGSLFADFVGFLHGLLSTAQINVITPIVRTDTEAANNLGYTLPQYRTAITSALASTVARVSDGASVVSAANIGTDGVHPIDAGHVELVNYVAYLLGGEFYGVWGGRNQTVNSGFGTVTAPATTAAQPFNFASQASTTLGTRGAGIFEYEVLDATTAPAKLYGITKQRFSPDNTVTPNKGTYDELDAAFYNSDTGAARVFASGAGQGSGATANGFATGDRIRFVLSVDTNALTKSVQVLRNGSAVGSPISLAYNTLYYPSVAMEPGGGSVKLRYISGELVATGAVV